MPIIVTALCVSASMVQRFLLMQTLLPVVLTGCVVKAWLKPMKYNQVVAGAFAVIVGLHSLELIKD